MTILAIDIFLINFFIILFLTGFQDTGEPEIGFFHPINCDYCVVCVCDFSSK